MTKRYVLSVAENGISTALFNHYFNVQGGKFEISRLTHTVAQAVDAINEGAYQAVILESLSFPLGVGGDKYKQEVATHFGEFDRSPFYSSGLFIAKRACKKGLVTILSPCGAESNRVLGVAIGLGVKVLDGRDRFRQIMETLNGSFGTR